MRPVHFITRLTALRNQGFSCNADELFVLMAELVKIKKSLKGNNFVSIDFETKVFRLSLINMKLCIRIINKNVRKCNNTEITLILLKTEHYFMDMLFYADIENQNHRFFDFFRGYKKRPVKWNRLKSIILYFLRVFIHHCKIWDIAYVYLCNFADFFYSY